MSESDVDWELARDATVSDGHVHVIPLTRRRRRSRIFIAAVVLLCLLFAFVAVAAIRSLHNPTATAGPQVASTSQVSSPEVLRVLAATDAARTATVTTRSRLKRIPGIPTLTNVGAIINPYVSSLQRYETILTGSVVPATARTKVLGARSLVRQDVQYLSTINGLPSLSLGAYLAQVGQRSTQLQTAFSDVQGALQPATS